MPPAARHDREARVRRAPRKHATRIRPGRHHLPLDVGAMASDRAGCRAHGPPSPQRMKGIYELLVSRRLVEEPVHLLVGADEREADLA